MLYKVFHKKFSGKTIVFCRMCSLRHYEEVPTPKGLPFIGTKLALWRAGSSKYLHEYVDKRHKELGPIYKEQLGPVTGTFVADSEAIRSIFAQEGKYPVHIIPQPWVVFNEKFNVSRGLLFMNGPDWLENRRILNNILLKHESKWMEKCCDRVIDGFIKSLNNRLSGNCDIIGNLESQLYKIFLDILVCVLVGENNVECVELVGPSVQTLADNLSSVFETTSKLNLLPSDLAMKFRLPQWNSFENSMMNSLIDAKVLVDKLLDQCGDNNGLLQKLKEENMDIEQIRTIVADLILAAADTTAYTMQWVLYLVSKNIGIQEKIRNESSKPSSNYVKHVLKETLRLYPVAPFITRFLPSQSEILGYRIPGNSLIIMSIYTTGRQEKYFQLPGEFIPERWERGNEILATKQASLPFAMGARSCVGRKLAEYELQKMLVEIVNNFHLELCNKNKVDMVLKMIAVPSESIQLKFKKLH